MKKLLASLLLVFGLAPLAMAADLQAELMAVEKALWTAWARRTAKPFRKALTADAVEVVAGTSPVVGRDVIAKDISTLPCELRSFAHTDAKVRKLGRGRGPAVVHRQRRTRPAKARRCRRRSTRPRSTSGKKASG